MTKKPRKLTKAEKGNFDTLKRAAALGAIALMLCKDTRTGQEVPVICAAAPQPDGSVQFTPFAQLYDGTQYEWLEPPT